MNGFKKGYQPRINFVKNDDDDLLSDSNNILNRFKNYFCQLLMYLALMMLSYHNVHS